jgi:hypothetical protein
VTYALLAASLLLHSPRARQLALEPLMRLEAREHGIPLRVLNAVAVRESGLRWWASGDHGHALGLGQLHEDAIPGYPLTRWERLDPRSGAHFMALRLLIARRRCHGRPGWEANYAGKPCGGDVYRFRGGAVLTNGSGQ